MKAEKPASGILKQNDWGESIWYYVTCDCLDPDCAHTVNVEADDYSVTVHIHTKTTTQFWSKNRWRQIWQILTKGYVEMETTVILKEDQAYNYAEALINATNDVKMFKAKQAAVKEKK